MASTWIEPDKIIMGDIQEPPSQFDDPCQKILVMTRDANDDSRYEKLSADDILCKVDRAAMGISLETRTPFLDPDVIRLAMRIPTKMKIRDGEGKWILKQILYRHVPKDIIDRPKKGFAIPLGIWLRGPLREWAEDLLSYKRLSEDNLFNPDIIRETWAEHLSGRKDCSSKLWTILMFQSWRSSQE